MLGHRSDSGPVVCRLNAEALAISVVPGDLLDV